MNYLLSFLFAGTICAIGEFIYQKTKLTPGHIINLFVVIGTALSFFNIYDFLIENFYSGPTSLITNFGHSLYQGAKEGLINNNYLHMFTNMLKKSSGVLTVAIIMATLASLIKGPRPWVIIKFINHFVII